jgi:hypothetical protein
MVNPFETKLREVGKPSRSDCAEARALATAAHEGVRCIAKSGKSQKKRICVATWSNKSLYVADRL